MASVQELETAQKQAEPSKGERRFVLYNVSWKFYQAFLRELDDRPIRLTYDRGNLEIMSPSYEHETSGGMLGRFIEILTEELNIPIKAAKSTTFKRKDLQRGLEPDECFYVKNAQALRGKKKINLKRDPPPDLAIEVDISRSFLDRIGIYAALGVPEIWRFNGKTLRVYQLKADKKYVVQDHSPTFPFLPLPEVVKFLHQSITMDDTSLARVFRAWVRKKILPGWKGPSKGPHQA